MSKVKFENVIAVTDLFLRVEKDVAQLDFLDFVILRETAIQWAKHRHVKVTDVIHAAPVRNHMEDTTTYRRMDKLIAAGFLRRARYEHDKRIKFLHPGPKFTELDEYLSTRLSQSDRVKGKRDYGIV